MAATVATVAYLGPRSLRGLSAGPAFDGPTALYVSVALANTHVTFPARVRLVAAMNPCRCGHLGDPALACSASPARSPTSPALIR